MKPFLVISKYQEELILAVILACSIIGMLLLFGLGLSDTTYQGMSSDHIIGQQPKYPKSTRPALQRWTQRGSKPTRNKNACQTRINYSWKSK